MKKIRARMKKFVRSCTKIVHENRARNSCTNFFVISNPVMVRVEKNNSSLDLNPYPRFFGQIICADRVAVELYYGANFKWHMPI